MSIPEQQGCLLIFFTNFLALTIKAGVTSPESSGSTAYSVVLVIANACFFLAAFSNTWFVAKDLIGKRDVTVRVHQANCGSLLRDLPLCWLVDFMLSCLAMYKARHMVDIVRQEKHDRQHRPSVVDISASAI